MQVASERITSLCTSLGIKKGDKYIPSDDCQINLDELTFSIWRDDESLRNISIHVHDLGIFERDLIPILMLEEPLSYIALKALTACTFPFSSNVQNPQIHLKILQDYKMICCSHPEIFAKVLEYTASIIENPRAEQSSLNKAELSMTFIRNISIIPSNSDIHERIFEILDESLLFDVISSLKLSRFGQREASFSRILSGIFYGCFTPFLPLKIPQKKTESLLGSFILDQKQYQKSSSRHSHWNSALTIKSKSNSGFTYNGSINQSIINNNLPLPNAFHLRSKARPIDNKENNLFFSNKAEIAVAKIMDSRNFSLVFRSSIPRTFSAYDKSLTIVEQLHFADMTRFFYEFCLKKGGESLTYPLASPELIVYFLSMAQFWVDSKLHNLDGISIENALFSLCSYFSSLCSYLTHLIKNSIKEEEIKNASESVTNFSSEIENILILFLCKKTKSNTSLSMLKTNVIALERLYHLYSAAEEKKLFRKKSIRIEEDSTSNLSTQDNNFDTYSLFSSEMIISRLIHKQDVLIPFFILLKNYEMLNNEEINALTTMLRRFTDNRIGLAHLFKLPFIYTIYHLWNDKKFLLSKNSTLITLNTVLEDIIHKLFYNVSKDSSILISLLYGVESQEIFDEKFEQTKIYKSIGISDDVIDLLQENRIIKTKKIKSSSSSSSSDEMINLSSKVNLSSNPSSDNEEEEENISYKDVLKEMIEKNKFISQIKEEFSDE